MGSWAKLLLSTGPRRPRWATMGHSQVRRCRCCQLSPGWGGAHVTHAKTDRVSRPRWLQCAACPCPGTARHTACCSIAAAILCRGVGSQLAVGGCSTAQGQQLACVIRERCIEQRGRDNDGGQSISRMANLIKTIVLIRGSTAQQQLKNILHCHNTRVLTSLRWQSLWPFG